MPVALVLHGSSEELIEGTALPRIGVGRSVAHFDRFPFPRRVLSFTVESGWRRTVDCFTNRPVAALRPRCPSDAPWGFFPGIKTLPYSATTAWDLLT